MTLNSDDAMSVATLPPSADRGEELPGPLHRWLTDLRGAMLGAKTSRHIEHVHRMRVSSRRLRTALGLFEEDFGRKRVKGWRAAIARVGRSLGDVRDLDVQIEFLERFMAEHTDRAWFPGLERLLLRLTQRRDRRQRKLRKVLDRFDHTGVVNDIAGALDASGPQGPSLCRDVASAMINRRLNDMLALEQCLDDDRNVEGHHQLRIAAKRLRYTLEIFEPILGETTDAPLARVKRLQKILGDLHDCDVWIEFLPRFMEKERLRTRRFLGHTKGFKRIARGLEYLQEQRLRSRQDIFAALLEHWGECRRNGDWQVVRHLADCARASLAV